jgi:predicted DNA-binding protein with PD1-like motif
VFFSPLPSPLGGEGGKRPRSENNGCDDYPRRGGDREGRRLGLHDPDRPARGRRKGFPKLERRVSGYNLPALLPENGFHVAHALVGSESTLVTILEATLNLVHWPSHRSLVVFGYPDLFTAGDHVLDVLPFKPTALEGFDHLLVEYESDKPQFKADLTMFPPGKAFLIAEFGGQSKEEADANARRCTEALKKKRHAPLMKLVDDPREEEMIWKAREGGLAATAWAPKQPDAWPGWEDSAVPVEQVGPYLRELRKLFERYDYKPSIYGHLGQGCIHCRVPFDLYTADGIRKFESFMEEAAHLVVRFGGSLSGEHGDGQARAQFLPIMYGETLCQAFREFKSIWGPQWKMNPGKTIDAYKCTENLRLGPDYNPPQPQTHFAYASDRHSFARTALRCVGVGECRKEGGQVMCPSYQVTHEEMHCTRGRAHLLFGMLNGEVLTDGWGSEPVKEALDLCLACKGCKHDCPVNVDMATYKAEFLSHYYEGRLRPRHAYAMGWIWWSRLASYAPGLANFFSPAGDAPGGGAPDGAAPGPFRAGRPLPGRVGPSRRRPRRRREEAPGRSGGPARCGRPGRRAGDETAGNGEVARKAKKLNEVQGETTFAVVFDTGDEAMAGLLRFAREQRLGGSHFTAIGAFEEVTLGYFDWQRKEYITIPLREQVEVLSLIGDVAVDEAKGEPKLHAHVVVGLSDGTTRGGHLIEARVRPTLEVMLVESPRHLQRRHDPETGLALIRL